MKLVEVLIEYSSFALDRPFTYFYDLNKDIGKGFRVIVEFNNRELIGYVLSVKETDKTIEEVNEDLGLKINKIKDVLDTHPLLNDDLLQLADEVAKNYLAPKISVLQSMLPPSLKPRKSSLKGPKIYYDKYLIVRDINEEGLTPKQIEILRYVAQETKVLKREIKSVSVVTKLLELKKLDIVYEEKNRLVLPNYEYSEPKKLNDEQQKVVDEFFNSDDMVYLLQGVTGSGKTEVYLHITEQILAQGKNVLMLVPEISLTPIMTENFLRRFKDKVAVLHSELTPAEKYDEYRRIAKGDARIVVGVRSAIFAPILNIGLIILDEEHTESYKQDKVPFYHARDVALMRAKSHGAKVILGSATPSLESRARAMRKVYHFLRLNKRINEQELPETKIVNMLDYKNIDRDSFIFSKTLRYEISECLKRKEQVILLINRRGYSTSVTCRKCGHVFTCPNCNISLTYHKKDNMLKCHHCDHVEMMPEACPKCGSKYFMRPGFGTEKIENELHTLFPEIRTLRLDSDTAKVRSKIQQTIESFRRHEADVLIGTQMIAKGHDFPNVTLVGIVLADVGLTMPNYRSAERTFQLITQAIGRSGRGDKKGKAIIQTYEPNHYSILLAAKQNYDLFFKEEMGMRKMLYYPPYCYLACIGISSKNEELAIKTSQALVDELTLKFSEKGNVIGPSTPYVSFVGGKHLRNILIKYRDINFAHPIFEDVIKTLGTKSSITLTLNVDPYDF